MPALPGDRWRALAPYLDSALDMRRDERLAWLERLRADDSALAADLQSLLDAHEAASRIGFLGHPPVRLRSEPEPSAGTIAGPYTLLSPIGRGGMGTVWLAERNDGRFSGRVAIKFLNPGLAGGGSEARFAREARILARLTHPNIAGLLDAGVSPLRLPYMVLEYVDGEHIDLYCDRRRLGVAARVRLFADVLDAVSHAHANLIVHRDIKPSNVLVRGDGTAKLLDFGIAKLLEAEARETAPTVTMEAGGALTPAFAAPEQLTGGAVTTATDVYALGVLLYVLLCGRRPGATHGGAPADVIDAIVHDEAPRASGALAPAAGFSWREIDDVAARRGTTPDRLRRSLRGDLDAILARALEKPPGRRYASVALFADDLRHHLDGLPIAARSDALGSRAVKFVRRHVRAVTAGASILVLLASVTTFYTVRLAGERDRARAEAEKAAKIASLLGDLLAPADARSVRGASAPTLLSLLDAGAGRLQREFDDQPEIQAEMLTVVGRVFQRLGHFGKARPLLEQAVAIGRRTRDADPARFAGSLHDLGVLLRETGDYAAAEPMLLEALALRRRLFGLRHKDVATTLVEIGVLHRRRGFADRAEPLFRDALTMRRQLLGEDDRETATSENDLALVLWERGDLAGAEPLLRAALATSRRALGVDHPNVASMTNNLALVLQEKEDYPGAESLFREALAIRRRRFGDRDPGLAVTLNNLAQPLRAQARYVEAAALLREALALARPALGDDHVNVASFMANLAQVQLANGEPAPAEPLLRRALETRRRLYPAGDWRIGTTESLLGECLTALGRYTEAERLLKDAFGILHDVPGRQGREAQANRARLTALYERWGRPQQAAPYRSAAARSVTSADSR